MKPFPTLLLTWLVACTGPSPATKPMANTQSRPSTQKSEVATFGAGCFWCVEAVYQQIPGVIGVRSGYMGGSTKEPTYEQVCNGTTGHAEVVQLDFDPTVVSYEQLREWFFRLHDPTTLNRQGADVGTQYRSVVFAHSPQQKAAAMQVIDALTQKKVFDQPIVTEVAAAGEFWRAEAYHQDYYRQNKAQGYCRVVIRPKLEKLGLVR